MLIECPECKRQVSDSAELCPGCGYRLLGRENLVVCPRCNAQVIPRLMRGDFRKLCPLCNRPIPGSGAHPSHVFLAVLAVAAVVVVCIVAIGSMGSGPTQLYTVEMVEQGGTYQSVLTSTFEARSASDASTRLEKAHPGYRVVRVYPGTARKSAREGAVSSTASVPAPSPPKTATGADRVGDALLRVRMQAAIEGLRKADPLGSPDDLFTDSRYFTGPPLTDEMIQATEAKLGYKLPKAYLCLLRIRNGGSLKRDCLPYAGRDDWPPDFYELSGIQGIGGQWGIDAKGLGSRDLIEGWGYPKVGVVFGQTPSAGHDIFMFDYSACGPKGEPRVIHVETETAGDPEVKVVAADFEAFLRALVNRADFLCAAARVKFGAAIERNPRDADAYFEWGDALDDAGRYAEACEKFAKAAEFAPRDTRVYEQWARTLVSLHRFAEACQTCAKAAEINPKNAMAYWWWGIALTRMKQDAKAEAMWEKAIELDPSLKPNLDGLRKRLLGEE